MTSPAKRAWRTIKKSGRIMHTEIEFRAKNQRVGTLRIGPHHIGWIPRNGSEPIEKTWKQFENWMKSS